MTSVSEYCINVKPYRLDCGCSLFDCGTDGTEQQEVSCLIDTLFKDENGRYDTNCDQIETEANIVLSELIGVCSATLNGEDISNLFCLMGSEDCEIPETGSFRFKDDWNIIYDVAWEYNSGRIDITFTTFDPRIPGQEPEGFIIGKQVYKKGIITTTRSIVQKEEDGSSTIVKENSTQKIDFFRTTFDCGDPKFTDPFKFHLDCAVSDDLEIEEIGSGASGT